MRSFLGNLIYYSKLLTPWENYCASWPKVLLYHYVGDLSSNFFKNTFLSAIDRHLFFEQIEFLKKSYRFIPWNEYRESSLSSQKKEKTILLTFDDGYRSSWEIAQELATTYEIPSIFFINTRSIDNQYTPWMLQFYYLYNQQKPSALSALWKSISNGNILSLESARKITHKKFSTSTVVFPIEESLAKIGMQPSDIASNYQLFASSKSLQNHSPLIELGNHSHSHYILSKITDEELKEDYLLSYQFFQNQFHEFPECYAYPFGITEVHFNHRCYELLYQVHPQPSIFSGIDHRRCKKNKEIGRCILAGNDSRCWQLQLASL